MAIAYENQNSHTYLCPRVLVGNFMLSFGHYGHYAILKTTKTGFEWPVIKDEQFEDCHWKDLVYASISGQNVAYFLPPNELTQHPRHWAIVNAQYCYKNWYIFRPWHGDVNDPCSRWQEGVEVEYMPNQAAAPNPTHAKTPQSARIKTQNGNFIVAIFNGSEFLFHWADSQLNPKKDADVSDWLFALTWGQPIQRGRLPKQK